jgi:predicted 3-demethylubiquinone-9 3-methyltransferase (glyoxalase superfamily)
MNFYVGVFSSDSKIVSIKCYPTDMQVGPLPNMGGKVLTGVFELLGQRFMALDGGPYFKFNPSVSFTVNLGTAAEVDALYKKLAAGGKDLMPLNTYPWSERYTWFEDKYGASWQITVGSGAQKIVSTFLFVGANHGKAEEAIAYYTSIFRNSSVKTIARYKPGEMGEVGKVKYSLFALEGQDFSLMESNLDHKFAMGGAISHLIECKDQAEIDYYWEKLTAGGDPNTGQCGWLADKYGVSWQVVPNMEQWLSGKDKAGSNRAMQAMLQMKKIDIAGLEKAYNGR